ncbi:LysR family transcriptional regulator [Gluconobacter cerinus]|uniref:LysR family transcriptional regulator n=1 Tax=Gluconobacter cerinus TaxID=38307 RepID=A0AAV5NI28_9PROT|nr:LysR family transcriptional regulator [Gluconobacter cerinus]GLQ63921.1 LysR family transcriptional regulator [Gluconobacter cerinus]
MIDIARFDFNLITTFLALWEERSVSKAARRLSLSQSAVSTALGRLRDATQDPLFVRTRDGMQPTQRAIAMAEPLQCGAGLIHKAFLAGAVFDPATSHQHFSIGMSDDFEVAGGPLIAQRLATQAPHISVTFRQANRHTVETLFETGEIDFAVVANPVLRSGLLQQDIGTSGYACLLDPEACGITLPLSLETYLALPHILVSYSGRKGIVDQVLKKMGHERRVQSALTHFSALPAFLIGTRAVATLPLHAARSLATISELTVCPAPVDLGRFSVAYLWQRTADNSWMRQIISEAFCEALSENVADT